MTLQAFRRALPRPQSPGPTQIPTGRLPRSTELLSEDAHQKGQIQRHRAVA